MYYTITRLLITTNKLGSSIEMVVRFTFFKIMAL